MEHTALCILAGMMHVLEMNKHANVLINLAVHEESECLFNGTQNLQ